MKALRWAWEWVMLAVGFTICLVVLGAAWLYDRVTGGRSW